MSNSEEQLLKNLGRARDLVRREMADLEAAQYRLKNARAILAAAKRALADGKGAP